MKDVICSNCIHARQGHYEMYCEEIESFVADDKATEGYGEKVDKDDICGGFTTFKIINYKRKQYELKKKKENKRMELWKSICK